MIVCTLGMRPPSETKCCLHFFGPDAIVPSKTRLATGNFIKILPIVGVSLDIPKTDHNRPI